MSLRDYYLSNTDDKSKLFVYVIFGDSTLKMKYKNCVVGIGGKTLNEAEQTLDRILNNPTEEDKKFFDLENKENFNIKKLRVKVKDGDVYPVFFGDTTYWEIKDEEMINYYNSHNKMNL